MHGHTIEENRNYRFKKKKRTGAVGGVGVGRQGTREVTSRSGPKERERSAAYPFLLYT
jgi:hypothetical protein